MQNAESKLEFKLSEPGGTYSQSDAGLMAYLQSYGLPYPPLVRYGNIAFDSGQAKHRVQLFGQAWLPQHAVGTVFFVHGFAEHAANYAQLIQDLVAANYAVAALDLRGHGLSEGVRGHCDTPHCYAEDIEQWANLVYPKLAPSSPLYLWGHSMGAMVTIQAILRGKLPRKPSAAVITSPFLGFPRVVGYRRLLMKIARLLARIVPAFPFTTGLEAESLSANREYLLAREEDPLIHQNVTPLWALCMTKAIAELHSHAREFQKLTPTLALLAGDERITDLLSARAFAFEAYSSLRHKVIEFPNMRHELEKEPVRERVLAETLAWFSTHR